MAVKGILVFELQKQRRAEPAGQRMVRHPIQQRAHARKLEQIGASVQGIPRNLRQTKLAVQPIGDEVHAADYDEQGGAPHRAATGKARKPE